MSNPTFEHRHFKVIAALIADTADTVTQAELALRFASFFATTNSRFDRKRFLDATTGKPSNGRDVVRS